MNKLEKYTQIKVFNNKSEYELYKNIVNQTPHIKLEPIKKEFINKTTKLPILSNTNQTNDNFFNKFLKNKNVYNNNLINKMNKIEINNYNFPTNENNENIENNKNNKNNEEKLLKNEYITDIEKLNYELSFINHKHNQILNKYNDEKSKIRKKEIEYEEIINSLKSKLLLKEKEVIYLKQENSNLLKTTFKKFPNLKKSLKDLQSKVNKLDNENISLKGNLDSLKQDNIIFSKMNKIHKFQLKEKIKLIANYEDQVLNLKNLLIKEKNNIRISNTYRNSVINGTYYDKFIKNKIKNLNNNKKDKINLKDIYKSNNKKNSIKNSSKKVYDKHLSNSVERFNINASYYHIKNGKILKKN